ncbi:uracil-DNA glycosylase family protein [Pseudacidovorax intermedius]|uniref:uracil-DNA glycosylase family protein n=1 Tax=Pseudacidovorax intermedius TaxID=433924 RepID=UPI000A85EC47|nr:uracil-DNA glycosylase family protein [Pseudacidovorax intermedius]
MKREPSTHLGLTAAQHAAFRRLAQDLLGIDREAYESAGRDWRDPVIGLGPRDAALCLFGRDPGRTEAQQGQPFLGKGGQLVRAALHRQRHGADAPAPDFAQSIEAGSEVFWLNTAPYKPVGNKAWSMAVKRRFQPLMAELLIDAWQGRDGRRTVIALGREAFFWFGIGQAAELNAALDGFWALGDARYARTLEVGYEHGGSTHPIVLAPLPHPSPANAVWFSRFSALMDARLKQLG